MPAPANLGPFLDSVAGSGLLSAEILRPYAELEPPSSSPDHHRMLAARLVKDKLLTPFQARQLLARRTHGFFLANKYRVLDFLGTGGMGHVFLCEHLLLQRLVAVKVLQRATASGSHGGPAAAIERFLREARAVAALDHPNIVRVFDMERVGNVPFMVMEYVDGASMHQIVSRFGPLTSIRAAHYARQAAAGLQHAHEHGLIHRDIKPGNLLLDRSGTVKILDLGLARFLRDVVRNADVTARYDDNKSIVGTVDYMSPEHAMNSLTVDIRSDIYSLGATLYFLLTGRAPFESESLAQKLVGHQFRIPAAVQSISSDVPLGLADVATRMLAKDPADRFQTPAEVWAALAEFAGMGPPAPAPEEMPATSASEYRLGLSPAYSSASVAASAGAGAASFPLPIEAGANGLDTPRLQDSETDLVRTPAAEIPSPTSAVATDSVAPLSTQRGRRRKHLLYGLVGGTSAMFIALFAVWFIAQNRSDSNPPDSKVPQARGGDPAAPSEIVLTGSGSTFIRPAMDHWARIYEKKMGVRIKYDGIGSGRGVENMIDRVLDFGCTDAALTDIQLAKARDTFGDVVHIPLALGAVVATYNIPDLTGQLRFTGPVLADIFHGKIRKWDHPAIGSSNPGIALPDLGITVVHRSDSSGTTFIWTDFLRKSSAEWETKIGTGTRVNWPIGDEGDKNDGVAKAVSRKVGAIGYVELSFALEQNLKIGQVKNQAGKYVEPTLESVTAAANASLRTIPPDLRFTLTDAPGEESYPIAGCAWAVFYVNQSGPIGKDLLRFFNWTTHEGQEHLKELLYAPLPARLVARSDEKLATIQTRQ